MRSVVASVDIAQIASGAYHFRQIFLGLRFGSVALCRHDRAQRRVYVGRHGFRITANVDRCAALNPGPQVAGALEQAMLNVNSAFLVA